MLYYCRLCLNSDELTTNIITADVHYSNLTIIEFLYWIFDVEVDVNDTYSKSICLRCVHLLKNIAYYRDIFKRNQLELKSKGNELASVCTDRVDEWIFYDILRETKPEKKSLPTDKFPNSSLPIVSITRLENSVTLKNYDKISDLIYKKKRKSRKDSDKTDKEDNGSIRNSVKVVKDDTIKVPTEIFNYCIYPSLSISKIGDNEIFEGYQKINNTTYREIPGKLDLEPDFKRSETKRLRFVDYYYRVPTTALQQLIKEKQGGRTRTNISPKLSKNTELVKINDVCEVRVCKYCSKSFEKRHMLMAHYKLDHKTPPKPIGVIKRRNSMKQKFTRPKLHIQNITKNQRIYKTDTSNPSKQVHFKMNTRVRNKLDPNSDLPRNKSLMEINTRWSDVKSLICTRKKGNMFNSNDDSFQNLRFITGQDKSNKPQKEEANMKPVHRNMKQSDNRNLKTIEGKRNVNGLSTSTIQHLIVKINTSDFHNSYSNTTSKVLLNEQVNETQNHFNKDGSDNSTPEIKKVVYATGQYNSDTLQKEETNKRPIYRNVKQRKNGNLTSSEDTQIIASPKPILQNPLTEISTSDNPSSYKNVTSKVLRNKQGNEMQKQSEVSQHDLNQTVDDTIEKALNPTSSEQDSKNDNVKLGKLQPNCNQVNTDENNTKENLSGIGSNPPDFPSVKNTLQSIQIRKKLINNIRGTTQTSNKHISQNPDISEIDDNINRKRDNSIEKIVTDLPRENVNVGTMEHNHELNESSEIVQASEDVNEEKQVPNRSLAYNLKMAIKRKGFVRKIRPNIQESMSKVENMKKDSTSYIETNKTSFNEDVFECHQLQEKNGTIKNIPQGISTNNYYESGNTSNTNNNRTSLPNLDEHNVLDGTNERVMEVNNHLKNTPTKNSEPTTSNPDEQSTLGDRNEKVIEANNSLKNTSTKIHIQDDGTEKVIEGNNSHKNTPTNNSERATILNPLEQSILDDGNEKVIEGNNSLKNTPTNSSEPTSISNPHEQSILGDENERVMEINNSYLNTPTKNSEPTTISSPHEQSILVDENERVMEINNSHKNTTKNSEPTTISSPHEQSILGDDNKRVAEINNSPKNTAIKNSELTTILNPHQQNISGDVNEIVIDSNNSSPKNIQTKNSEATTISNPHEQVPGDVNEREMEVNNSFKNTPTKNSEPTTISNPHEHILGDVNERFSGYLKNTPTKNSEPTTISNPQELSISSDVNDRVMKVNNSFKNAPTENSEPTTISNPQELTISSDVNDRVMEVNNSFKNTPTKNSEPDTISYPHEQSISGGVDEKVMEVNMSFKNAPTENSEPTTISNPQELTISSDVNDRVMEVNNSFKNTPTKNSKLTTSSNKRKQRQTAKNAVNDGQMKKLSEKQEVQPSVKRKKPYVSLQSDDRAQMLPITLTVKYEPRSKTHKKQLEGIQKTKSFLDVRNGKRVKSRRKSICSPCTDKGVLMLNTLMEQIALDDKNVSNSSKIRNKRSHSLDNIFMRAETIAYKCGSESQPKEPLSFDTELRTESSAPDNVS